MFTTNGPVILIEDDTEEHDFMREAYASLNMKNKLNFFTRAQEALDYQLTTTDKPFIIISETKLQGMDGVALRKAILSNDYLRKKSIPFVFFTNNPDRADVEAAYDLQVQGYFIKKYSIPETSRMLQQVFDYWRECYHPNNLS